MRDEQDERAFLNAMLDGMRQGLGPEGIAQEFSSFLRRSVAGADCQVWLRDADRLRPVGLTSHELAQSTQDLEEVSRLWQASEVRGGSAPPPRLVNGWHYLTLERVGGLRLRVPQELPPDRWRFLQRACLQAGGVIRSQLERQELQAEVERLRRRQQALETESSWLYRSLSILQDCAGVLELPSLVQAFSPLLRGALSTDLLLLAVRPDTSGGWALTPFASVAAELKVSPGLGELLEVCTRYGRALDYGRLEGTRFAGAVPGYAALALAPLSFEQGAVVAVHGSPCAFSAEALRNFQLGASLFGCLWKLASLHRQTRETLAALQESELQLVQAGKLAAVGQIAAGVAHEMNNPLAAVRLALDVARRQKSLPESTVACLDSAVQAVERCRAIAGDLLRFSRESQHQQVAPVDMCYLIDHAITLVRQQAEAGHVRLEVTLPSEPPQVEANSGELQQLLLHLLDNALQAARGQPGREGRVQVVATAETGTLRLRIRDNGPGVPPELRERIFEPFFSTRKMSQGAGLGLAVSRRIANSCGGEVELLPDDGSGAEFELRLPLLSPRGGPDADGPHGRPEGALPRVGKLAQ